MGISDLTIKTFKQAKRLVRIVVGFTVLLIGLALTVLPGPAFIVIPVGLVILAGEFVWARRLLNKFNDGINHGLKGLMKKSNKKS